jgi:hypothetical protein
MLIELLEAFGQDAAACQQSAEILGILLLVDVVFLRVRDVQVDARFHEYGALVEEGEVVDAVAEFEREAEEGGYGVHGWW